MPKEGFRPVIAPGPVAALACASQSPGEERGPVMKYLVPARAFRKRLAAVASVIPRHSPKPILSTIRLEVDGRGRGTLVATDLETWVRARAPVSRSLRAGVAQLPLRALASILEESGDREVELDADPDAFGLVCREAELPSRLIVAGPHSRATLPTHRTEDYPAREEPPSPGHHVIERHHLARLVRTTCFAVDPSCTRYQLGGCSFELGEDSVDAVATDGCRLAHAWRRGVRVVGAPAPPAQHMPSDRTTTLAPVVGAAALRVLLRMLAELRGPLEPAELDWAEDGYFRVRSGDLRFASRQLAGRFPAWRDAFPAPSPHRGHFGRSDRLLAILKRARSLAGRNQRAVRVGLRRGGLTLALEAGFGVERFETYCDCRSESAEAVLNIGQLIDVLDALDGETVDLELNGPGVPSVIHANGLRYCMMSMGGDRATSGAADGQPGPAPPELEQSAAAVGEAEVYAEPAA